ncbi:MAG: hypothetical protein R3296_13195 [Oleiphilaceae bacterium]|nr:hypothetical protein [Oleiphilaceae bacterium]
MTTISSVALIASTGRKSALGALIRPLLVLSLLAAVAGCTSTYKDFEKPQQSGEVSDDRPLASFNRLMAESLPMVRHSLEQALDLEKDFRPMAFALSRQGGVRPVSILGATARDDEARLNLLFNSLEVMTRGDDIVAFVVYATGSGYLVNTPTEDQVLVAHLEHHSGRAVLRRLSYRHEEGRVEWGAEDVDGSEALIFTDSQSQ